MIAKKKKVNKSKKFNKSTKRINMYIIGIFLLILVLIIGIVASYAYWNTTVSQKGQNYVEAGCLSFTFNDKDIDNNVTNIELLNSYPISDQKGLTLKPYTFTITNTCTLNGNFNIYLHNLSTSTMDSSYVKIALNSNNTLLANSPILVNELQSCDIDSEINTIISSVGAIKEDYLLYNFNLEPEKSITFELQLWIDEEAPNSIMGQTYEAAISVFANPLD